MFHQNLRGAAEFGEGETTPPSPFPLALVPMVRTLDLVIPTTE